MYRLSFVLNKKKMTEFEKITSFENLYRAFKAAKSGKGYRKSSASFDVEALSKIHNLKTLLETKKYEVSEYNSFYVYEPKKRLIDAGTFVDKIVQHSLCDNVLLPKLSDVFIRNNFAGQIGKGTTFGLQTLREHMKDFYRENGMNGYILKADVTKFFYSIDHEILKRKLCEYFDDSDVLWLCNKIIDSTKNPGLPLGNQSSQVFGLLYLNDIDYLITKEFGIERYGRYMDDFYLIHNNKAELKEMQKAIECEVSKLQLSLNGKTQIMPFKQGIRFLGFHTYVFNGNVISRVVNENKRNALRKYRRMSKLVQEGKLSNSKLTNSLQSYKNHISFGDCEGLIDKLNMEFILKEETK